MGLTERTAELLEVLRWPGIGPVRARAFLSATAADASILATARELGPAPSRDAQETARQERDDIADTSERLGTRIVGLPDKEYPRPLSLIPDPPPILYVRGAVEVLSHPAVAVVGTRKASASGSRSAQLIASFLVRKGFTVVSGLALGIDTAAHLGALDVGGLSIAVLAHGLDTVAPSSNRPLASRIVESGGALVTEHPPGVPPRPPAFVRRNRIQSGLCLGSIIVESDCKGGAIHQANFTKSQGRRLMTVLAASEQTRGDLNEAGARHLVNTAGAIALSSTGDLVRELELLLSLKSVSPGNADPMLF